LNVTLRGSDSPCKGRLEVYHGDKKQWGLVCHFGWKKENGEVVCKSIGCGNHKHSDRELTLYKDSPLPQQYWMDEVKCTSKEESLWKCPYVDITKKEQCDESSFVAVECSGSSDVNLHIVDAKLFTTGEVTLSLNLNGQQDVQVCAGVVEFTTANGIIGVCNKNWDRTKANKICQELGCGDHHYIPKPGMFKEQTSKKNVLLNCVSDEKFSWQCMEWAECQERASVICSSKCLLLLNSSMEYVALIGVNEMVLKPLLGDAILLSISMVCVRGILTITFAVFTDSVKLHNFTTECFGDVSIDVNGTYYGVCYSNLDSIQSREKMGAVVCRELGCGDIVRVKQGSSDSNGLLSNVDCQGDERSLWHCLAIREKKQCLGTKVICSEEELKFFEGNSPCKGKVCIEKFDGNKPDWLPAKPVEENKKKATDICSAMQCGSLVSFETEQNTTYAKVTCSGSKRVEPRVALQNPFGEKCWGMVKVCGDGKCGGVCSNTWRTNDSKTICENLDCGNPIRAQLPLQINNLPATYRSVYCSEKVQNMNMCNFIPNKNSTCKPLAQVICTGNVNSPFIQDQIFTLTPALFIRTVKIVKA
ncbi:hypothetical protein cypCar_00027801, partial [Cyprinus carpio]